MIAMLTPLLYSLGPAALLLVMAVVFAESGLLLGFFLPGDSFLFLAGALVASHVIGLPGWLLVLGVFVAAVAGDQVGYLIGRRFGSSPVLPAELANLRAGQRRPGSAVLRPARRQGRRPGPLRPGRPYVRACRRRRRPHATRRRFTTYNLVGAAVWSVGIVVAGILFGGIWFVAAHIELITIGLAGSRSCPVLSRTGTAARSPHPR